MPKKILVNINKRAYTNDIGFLARAETIAFPELDGDGKFFGAREHFWRGLLTPTPEEGRRVSWSQEEGNPNIRIARASGAVRISGYLALNLPVDEKLGLIRPGLNIVVVSRYPEADEVHADLIKLGEKLCPQIVEVAEIHPSQETLEIPHSATDTTAAIA